MGTPDYKQQEFLSRRWLVVAFGSGDNIDEALFDVGCSVRDYFAPNSEPSACFLVPLIRSLVVGGGYDFEGRDLRTYLLEVETRRFEMFEFREDSLRTFWIGGHISLGELSCIE